MSWRDRREPNQRDANQREPNQREPNQREPNQRYHERWSEVARNTDPQWNNDTRHRQRQRSPVWDMRKASPRRSRSNERYDRGDDRNRFSRENDRSSDRADRNNERLSQRNDRFDRNTDRSDQRRDRVDRNNDRFDRNNDRDRFDRNRDDRYSQRNNDRDREERTRDRDSTRERDQSEWNNRGRENRSSSNQRYDKIQDDNIPKAPSPPKLTEHEKEEMRSYSDRRESNGEAAVLGPGDWLCVCGAKNFRFRYKCYKHNCTHTSSEGTVLGDVSDTGDETKSGGITKRLLFRRLDTLTTEEKILEILKQRVPKVVETIAKINIGRDSLTGTSRGLAYITFNSLADSSNALEILLKLSPHLRIDGRDVLISYCHDKPKSVTAPSIKDYSAYYAQAGINAADYNTQMAAMSQMNSVNAAAAVAQLAITAAQARQQWMPAAAPTFVASATAATVTPPNGKGNTKYSAPDVRTFMYDETSGYYYDASTGLYYDASTQYFYNNQLNKYTYWDATQSTYYAATEAQQNTEQPKLPAPPQATVDNTITKEAVAAPAPTPATATPVEEKKKKDKDDKVKVAKKIAKDMERWAKTLNQKKENARNGLVMEQPRDMAASKGSADIGFSVLGASGPAFSNVVREITPPPTEEFLVKKVEEPMVDDDEGIIDWSKLTCLICKRRFPSMDVLTKHKNISDLHRQNLVEYRKNNDSSLQESNGYRDRAAERRLKYGEVEEPVRKRYVPPPALQPPVQSSTSVVDTIGGKMLQKMGWTEGRGLGREEQGRTAPIEAEKRPQLAGLGQKRGIYTAAPGETYKDTVKKLAIARYNDLLGEEE